MDDDTDDETPVRGEISFYHLCRGEVRPGINTRPPQPGDLIYFCLPSEEEASAGWTVLDEEEDLKIICREATKEDNLFGILRAADEMNAISVLWEDEKLIDALPGKYAMFPSRMIQ